MNTHTTFICPFKTEPMAHQHKALMLGLEKTDYALWMEQGTGKTKVIIDNMRHLWASGKINAALIVAPKGVYLNWLKNEIPKHAFDHEFTITAYSSDMTRKEREYLDRFIRCDMVQSLKVIVANVEAFSGDGPVKLMQQFIERHKTFVCVDESTRIKNHKAKRSKALIKLGRHAMYRRLMSGTPITRNPLDLYGQCAFLGHHLLGFTSFYTFRNRYAEIVNITMGNRSFPKITGYKNQDELARNLDRFSYRCLKKDCLDLPPKVYQKVYVEMTPEQKEIYEKFKTEAVVQLKDKSTVSTVHVLTAILRLHQIVCGHIKTDDGRVVDLASGRIEVLAETIDDCTGQVIIWCNYQRDVENICMRLRDDHGKEAVVEYYGKTSDEDREKAITNFQSGKSRFFVGTCQTGGLGITLTAAETVIYFSNGYNLEHRLQSEDRAHRIGQTRTVTYIDLVTPNTIDEKIIKALDTKQDLANMILDELGKGELTLI